MTALIKNRLFVYIIPFIANNYYWFGSDKTGNGLNWSFDLGNIDPGDRILIDYPLGDFDTNELDQLWDISKIFEAAHCIWIDPGIIALHLDHGVAAAAELDPVARLKVHHFHVALAAIDRDEDVITLAAPGLVLAFT